MAVAGEIAAAARGELPETWRALESASDYGDPFLERKVTSVIVRLFGEEISSDVQSALDKRVIDFAGKLVALEIINPGIDWWSKQPLTIGATGRNENKGYNDRSAALRELRVALLEQTRVMWAEVEQLLPGNRVRTVGNVPRVRDIANAHTPNPYDFEPPFG